MSKPQSRFRRLAPYLAWAAFWVVGIGLCIAFSAPAYCALAIGIVTGWGTVTIYNRN